MINGVNSNKYFSAVDAHVAKYILEECLTKKLKDKTRVLVTHKLESLKYVDFIYLMKGGEVIAEGTFEAIKKTKYYKEIEEKSNKEVDQDEQQEEETLKEEEEVFDAKKSLKKISEKMLRESEKKTQRKETSFHEGHEQKEMLEKLMLNEDRQTGAVSWAIWKSFLNYFGSVQFFIVLMTGIVLWMGLTHNGTGVNIQSRNFIFNIFGIFFFSDIRNILLINSIKESHVN